MYVLDVVHILLSEIQKGPLRCLDKLIALSKNAEDGVEWPLASAYMLCLYKSHWLYVSDQKLGT